MTDDDALDSMDTEDTEEEMFNPRKSKGPRTLRSQSTSTQQLDQNNSIVRRSTRNKSQTYDNLNTSWIFGKLWKFKLYLRIHVKNCSYRNSNIERLPNV